MCELCQKYRSQKNDSLKNSGGDSTEVSQSELVLAGLDDIKFLSPSSSGVVFSGTKYQRSWYEAPEDFGSAITISYAFATQEMLDDKSTRAGSQFSYDPTQTIEKQGAFLTHGAEKRKEFTEAQKSATREMLDHIETFVNIKFEEVTSSNSNKDRANLLIASGDLEGSTTGLATLPSYGKEHSTSQKSGTIFLDNYSKSADGDLKKTESEKYERGGVMYKTLLHEIGHALGLKHPHGKVDKDNDPDDEVMNEGDKRLSAVNTIMSYKELTIDRAFVGGEFTSRYAKTFQYLDILALQSVYGRTAHLKDTEHRLEDKWNKDKDTGGMQEVLSDHSGRDSLLGHSTRPNRIDLGGGKFSDIGYGHDLWLGISDGSKSEGMLSEYSINDIDRIYRGEYNLVVTIDSVIENAVGGDKNDELTGNEYENKLEGLEGTDKLLGRDGSDRLSGGAGDDFLDGGEGGDIIDGGASNDVLSYQSSSQWVRVSLKSGEGHSGGHRDIISDIEGVIGSRFGDIIEGGDQDDVLVGGKGGDIILGGGGSDVIGGSVGDIGEGWSGHIKSMKNLLKSLLPERLDASKNDWGKSYASDGNLFVIRHATDKRVDVFKYDNDKWSYVESISLGETFVSDKYIALDDGLLAVGEGNSLSLYLLKEGSFVKLSRASQSKVFAGDRDQGQVLDNLYIEKSGDNFFVSFSLGSKVFLYRVSIDEGSNSYSLESSKEHELDFSYYRPGKYAVSKDYFVSFDGYSAKFFGIENGSEVTTIHGLIRPDNLLHRVANEVVLSARSVATSGDLLAFSLSPWAPEGAIKKGSFWQTYSGMLQVFRKKGGEFKQEAMIFKEANNLHDKFGTSIAFGRVNGKDYLAVGAPGAKKVYIYSYEGSPQGWTLIDTIEHKVDGEIGFGNVVQFDDKGNLIVSGDGGLLYRFNHDSFTVKGTELDNLPDKIWGGEGDDKIYSGKGSDVIDGGTGTDTVIYQGYSNDYTINKRVGVITVTDNNKVEDRLYNVDKIEFFDKSETVSFASSSVDTKAPTITIRGTELKLDEEGYVYVLALRSGSATPQKSEIRIRGSEKKLKAGETYKADLKKLESGNYDLHILSEDMYGNTRVEEVSNVVISPTITKGTFKKSGDYIKFSIGLSNRGKLYYSYVEGILSDSDADKEKLKGGEGSDSYGVLWVDDSDQTYDIFLKYLSGARMYLYADNGEFKEIEMSGSSGSEADGEEFLLGLSTQTLVYF